MIRRNQKMTSIKTTTRELGPKQAFVVSSVTEAIDPDRAALDAYSQIARVLENRKMGIFHERIFGSLIASKQIMTQREAVLHRNGISSDGPVTMIQGDPHHGKGLAGIVIHAVSNSDGDRLSNITYKDQTVGRRFESDGICHVLLQSIHADPKVPSSEEESVVKLIKKADAILKDQGSGYLDVVRTWFYISDILKWYDIFNKSRNHTYDQFGILPRGNDKPLVLPASTGIGGNNLFGTKAVADILAIHSSKKTRAKTGRKVERLLNSGQKEAFLYGSAFSRGISIKTKGTTIARLSGTASIDKQGQTENVGNVSRQVEYTLNKIESLLEPIGGDFKDTIAAMAFVKHASDTSIVKKILKKRLGEDFPCVYMVADVCRDDLLFELETDVAIDC